MRILVVNRGSSSIKASVFQAKGRKSVFTVPVWKEEIQWKNGSMGGGKAVRKLLSQVDPNTIDLIGHRVVHGGKYFDAPARINREVKGKIKKLAPLAPLHNFQALEGIEICEELFPAVPQVALFDTAFHRTIPLKAAIYPGPYAWFRKGIQRYGFHGISFQYCTKRCREILGKKTETEKIVICHLGAGASLCAVHKGKSLDTTMGFTPLEGLMMNTRSGSIDPGIIDYLIEQGGFSPKKIFSDLYNASGLLGVSGVTADMREILKRSERGEERSILALEIYLHRLNSLIGAMASSLGGLDVLVFTAGIGENASYIREKVCENFSFLGVKLDKKKNRNPSEEDFSIHAHDSKVQVLVIRTHEDLEIAQACLEMSQT